MGPPSFEITEGQTLSTWFTAQFPLATDFTVEMLIDFEDGEISNREILQAIVEDEVVTAASVTTASAFLYYPSQFNIVQVLRKAAGIQTDAEIFSDITSPFQKDRAERFSRLNFGEYFLKKIDVWVVCYSNILERWLTFSNITQITINTSNTGANFTLTLSLDEITPFEDQPISPFRSGDEDDNYVKSLGINDLVYISFYGVEYDSASISNTLRNSNWDLVGLVDNVTKSINSISGELSYNVTGRDLAKLFIEDGSYYFPIAYASGARLNVGEAERKEGAFFKRVEGGDFIDYLGLEGGFTIAQAFTFIMEALSTTNLIEDSVLAPIYERSPEREARGFYGGVWRLVRLAIEEKLSTRTIADSTIQQEQGSMLNSMQKYIVDPFAQMILDTYGSQYVLIIREPPFTEEGILNHLDSGAAGAEVTGLPFVEIDGGAVLNISLQFHADEDIYTWFRITPKGIFFSDPEILGSLPAVYFPEYVDRWGSKPYDKVTNYLRMDVTAGQEEEQRDTVAEASIRDLRVAVEMFQYLPFVRKGSITLSLIDSGIKKGGFVQITNEFGQLEIFYVDGVTYQYSQQGETEERTVVQVSRGMVRDYVEGNGAGGAEMTYFNIIDFKGYSTDETFTEGSPTVNWTVRKNVFDFFFKREQFNV